MINQDLAELDVTRYFLEEAQRRAGNLARSGCSMLKEFGREAHSQLVDLVRKLG